MKMIHIQYHRETAQITDWIGFSPLFLNTLHKLLSATKLEAVFSIVIIQKSSFLRKQNV